MESLLRSLTLSESKFSVAVAFDSFGGKAFAQSLEVVLFSSSTIARND